MTTKILLLTAALALSASGAARAQTQAPGLWEHRLPDQHESRRKPRHSSRTLCPPVYVERHSGRRAALHRLVHYVYRGDDQIQ